MARSRSSSPQTTPRPAAIWELLLVFSVALVGLGAAAGLVGSLSLRELVLEPHGANSGAAVVVHWHFFGVPVWQRHLPQVIDAEVLQETIYPPYDRTKNQTPPAPVIRSSLVLRGENRIVLLNLGPSSLIGEIERLQGSLRGLPLESEPLRLRETARSTADRPWMETVFGCVGILLGLLVGVFFFIAGCSAVWVRVTQPRGTRSVRR